VAQAGALASLLLLAAGCGGERSEQDYIPSTDKAQAALDKALSAWRSGQPPDKVEASNPAIAVLDSLWKSGKKLSAYEILKREPGEGPPWFTVKLELQGAAAHQQVRYVVVGIDPLWIYSEADYKQVVGMY
jgi:hypothetical protein